jgi:Domain of unknown function (DUF4129)
MIYKSGTLRQCRFRLAGMLLILLWANAAFAMSLDQYRDRVKRALNSLELLTASEETQTQSQRRAFVSENIRAAREVLPRIEKIEWNGASFSADNSWLDDELKQFEKLSDADPERERVLARILERLQALLDRLDEIYKGNEKAAHSKHEMKDRLVAILKRPEYAKTVTEETALGRLLRRLLKWLRDLFPKREPLSPGRTVTVSRIAQVFVVLVALAAVAYALWIFLPQFLANRKHKKKKTKPEARIVLGERLEPDQSAADILAEAESLARAGDLRGAIRKGYIALLVELGDRKIISLAQYKTNRDYLRAVREIERLHPKMKKLTDSFERHWYGLLQPDENDWMVFRAGFREAIAAT